jgi:hypothetical protein
MIFIDNKYTKLYFKIIERAKFRITDGYVEKHHVIPRSLGGNNKDNIVPLTAREHFVCHLLLTKMTTGKFRSKMVLAVFKLTGKGKRVEGNLIRCSRVYENLKVELSGIVSQQKKGCKQPPRTSEARTNYSNSKKGKLNPNFKSEWITPWGTFDSSRNAAKSCPEKISDVAILNFCQSKNFIPISVLSVCRSKGWLKKEHIGSTPAELGFRVR